MKKLVFTMFFVLMAAPSLASDRFAQMDTQGDGAVDFGEFSAAMPNMKKKAFETIDSNGDGRITREEWTSFSSQHAMKKSGPAMPGMHSGMPMPEEKPSFPGKKLVTPPKP